MNPLRPPCQLFCCLFLITPCLTHAGGIDSPAPPDDPAGAMFTLQAIFDRLNDGSAGTIRGAGFVEPTSGPAASASMNLNDIMGVAPLPDLIDGATPAEVLSGRTFWGLRTDGVWGPATGTLGGCTGTLNGTRWCDNGNGTVTDLSNGLVWLKDAGCVGQAPWIDGDIVLPVGAHTRASNLFDGSTLISGGDCGLTDGSVEGDWRLPTLGELKVLKTGTEPVLVATQRAFVNVSVNNAYWSSTSSNVSLDLAWVVFLGNGNVFITDKTAIFLVWAVRGGQ